MHRINISIPVYDFKCNIIIDDNIDEVINKYMKKFRMPSAPDGDEYHGLAFMSPTKQHYIFYDLQSITPGTVVHEICHMVDYLLEDRDIEQTGESRAYITGHITDKVFDFLLKHNILISKHLNYKQKPAPVAEGSKAGLCKSSQPLVQIQPGAQIQNNGGKES